jgi:hypothetical protein
MNLKNLFFFSIILIIILIIIIKKTENYNTTSECVDTDPNCNTYDNSECVRNPSYMMSKCPKKCKMCNLSDNTYDAIIDNSSIIPQLVEDNCRDISLECKNFLLRNPSECLNTPNYMNSYCKATCGRCNIGQPQQSQSQLNLLFGMGIFIMLLQNVQSNECIELIRQTNITVKVNELNEMLKSINWSQFPIPFTKVESIANLFNEINTILITNSNQFMSSCFKTNVLQEMLENPDNSMEYTTMQIVLDNFSRLLNSNPNTIKNIISIIKTYVNNYYNNILRTNNVPAKNFITSLNNFINSVAAQIGV